MAFWDAPATVWDGAGVEWQAPPPPDQGWGDDWEWWYQVGRTIVMVVTPMIVEARWTTDAHTMGDGTFRGDIQPGAATVRLWDPTHQLDNINKLGALWATYRPTGATWCWFYDSFTRGVVAPGDPSGADCVFTGTLWPTRLTTPLPAPGYSAQTVANRIAAIAAWMNSNTAFMLPFIYSVAAAQSQIVAAGAADQHGLYPSHLAAVRDAASTGVAWMSAGVFTAGEGRLTLNYARWETSNQRELDRSQIIAGPPSTASADWVITWVQFAGVNGSTGAQSAYSGVGARTDTWGYQGPTMRIWGNVALGGSEYAGVDGTAARMISDRSNPGELTLSTIDLQSGARSSPTGGSSSAVWDPNAHVFAPTDVAILRNVGETGGTARYYRVTKSDHRLTARLWQTTHTIEKYTPPTALP